MQNACTSSIISLRTSFPFNDYSYYSNERCPSSCCTCCSFPINSSRLLVPINPSFLYGLRQSTLIQLRPSRRLILGSSDRYCYQSPVHDAGRRCCREPCCVKQERVDILLGKSCEEKGYVKEKNGDVNKMRGRTGRRNYRYSAVGDAEAMLSLLAEESIEKCLDVRGRNKDMFKEWEIVREENVGVSESKDRKKNVGSGYLESESKKVRLGLARVQYGEKGHKRREEREAVSKDEDRRSRRRESSSSYYSLSDSGDFESDTEVEIKHEGSVGESSINHGKDSRKSGGIVIREAAKKDSKTYKDGRVQQLQSSTYDDSRVGSPAEWDWRKKSEKKLTEESVEETKSGKDSVGKQSQLSRAHESSSLKVSSSKKQFHYQGEESTSDLSSHRQSMSHTRTDDHASEYSKSSTRHEESRKTSSHNVETTSSTQRRSNRGEENVMVVGNSVQDTGCDYCQTCGQTMQQRAELSEIRGDARQTSSVQSESQSRLAKQEKSLSSLQSSVKEENKQQVQLVHMATGQGNVRRRSQRFSERVDTHDSYAEDTLISQQQQSEARMKNLVENSTSLISRQEVKSLREELDCNVSKETGSSEVAETRIGASQVHSTNVDISRQSASEQRIYDEQIHLKSKVKLVEELVEKRKQIDETIVQSRLRTEVQGPIHEAGFTGNISGEANIAQPSVPLISQTGIQQVSGGELKSDLHLQMNMISPSYQSMEKRHPYGEPLSSSMRNDSGRITEVGSSARPPARTPSSSVEVNGSGSKMYEEPCPEDALGSAKHMEHLSTQIVGEFVEKMRHEASTSETRMEKKVSRIDSKHDDEKHTTKGSTQSDYKKKRLQKQDSRHSSRSSGTKGPSDEMSDVKDHFVREPSEMESLGGEISEIIDTKRNGKSLWNAVAGIFQFRWGSRSETPKFPVNASGQSSSNESPSVETWFSGNEPDEGNGNSMKKDQTSMSQEPASANQPLLRRTSTRNQKEELGIISSDDKLRHVEVGSSSSSSFQQSSSLSGSLSTGPNTDLIVTQQTSQSTPPLDLLQRASVQVEGSHVEGIKEPGQNQEHFIGVRQGGVSASEITDIEVKQRKLQRSKQVLQERFDEWEDAYRRERELRKVDEIFMWEALVEAQKAADMWEVPVGAVLVQNGKIIARGYNLVEELRDSTAHAEMICIREASNVLRTWRLSETTLYVTLEPCPMCAGAILQARIGTLVWGAPNKLLGADGSWIRLFPEGEEGDQRSETTDKPPAPTHPFHPKMKIRRGVLEEECADIMQQFFKLRRKKEKKTEEVGQPSCLPVPHHPSKLLHKMHGIFHIMFCL